MSQAISPEGYTLFKAFSDNRHYPYGLERSGDFSIREAELLRRLGETFRRLEVGEHQAVNEVEEQFLKMIRGEKEASTDCEKLWLKYRARVKANRGRRSLLPPATIMPKARTTACHRMMIFPLTTVTERSEGTKKATYGSPLFFMPGTY